MISRHAMGLAAPIVALHLLGCMPFTSASEGDLGRVEYNWNEGLIGCLFGCDASAPLAVGSHALLVVRDFEDLSPFTVSSDAPEIALFSTDGVSDGGIRAEGVAPGRARVLLRDAGSGDLIDRLPITVRTVHRIESRPEPTDGALTLMVGGNLHVAFDLLDDRGHEMVGVGGIDYSMTSALEPEEEVSFLGLETIGDAIGALLAGTNHESADFDAVGPGTGALRVSAVGGASLEIAIEVVEAQDVTRVALVSERPEEDGGATLVRARAWAREREVIDPVCAWSIAPETGPLRIDWTDRDTASIGASGPGSAVVTCTIGTAQASTTVVYR